MTATTASFVATLLAMALSARLANAFLRASPRLYTAMALFTCCWAILVPYYSATSVEPSNLFRAISGFLLVYIGGLLMLEAQHRDKRHRSDVIVPWQIAGVYLLFLVITPPLVRELHLYTEKQAEFAVGIILDIAGFASVIRGMDQLNGRTSAIIVALLLVPYALAEIAVGVITWDTINNTPTLNVPEPLRYGFAAGKLIVAAVLGSLIAYAGMQKKVRKAGPRFWLLRVIGIDPAI